jgi:hypothetical protein
MRESSECMAFINIVEKMKGSSPFMVLLLLRIGYTSGSIAWSIFETAREQL